MPIEDIIHPFLKHYIAAPQWVKTLTGSVYSSVPTHWRYGHKYETFKRETEIMDDVEELNGRAGEKLLQTLRWAADTVPAYAGMAQTVKRDSSPEDILAKFPLLAKNEIKADISSFLSSEMPKSKHLITYTGGSTSVPMKLYLEKFVSRSKDFAYNNAFDRIAGITTADVILALRGRTVPGADKPNGPIYMFDPIKKYLHLSTDHLEPEYMLRYMEAIRLWKPTFIHAFPSAILPLAKWLKSNPAPEFTSRIRCIQLYSENVYGYQIELLHEIFNCSVLLDYGHSEKAVKAFSLPNDTRYFFWPLYGKLEIMDFDGRPITTPGVLGEIVATGFDNRVMPLVRYKTGDLAMWSATPNKTYPAFPVVDRIEGRLQEFLVCRDNRLVSICTIGAAHFEELAGAERMQFEQQESGRAVLKVLAKTELDVRAKADLIRGISKKTQGGLEIEIVRVDEIPRTQSGKHKMLVQKLDLTNYLGATTTGAANDSQEL